MGKTTELYEPSYTLASFCRAEDISEPTYCKLRAMGYGPEEMRYPGINIVRITHAARLAWQRMMQNPTGEHAAAVQRIAEQQKKKASQKYLKFQLPRAPCAACSNFCVGYPRMARVPPVLLST